MQLLGCAEHASISDFSDVQPSDHPTIRPSVPDFSKPIGLTSNMKITTPKRKTTSPKMEDELTQNGRRPKMKTTKNRDDQKLRQPKTKTTKNEDDQK